MQNQSCKSHCDERSEHDNDNPDDIGEVPADFRERGVSRKGGWPAAIAIIVNEFGNRMGYHCVSLNSFTYMTDVLHMSTAVSVVIVNIWSGTTLLLPLVGAFISNTYLGCYCTVIYSDLIFLVGSVSLTLSALPSFTPFTCSKRSETCPGATAMQLGWFFASIFLVSLGQGGHKPCLQTFGADQFSNNNNPNQATRRRSSFFNWWNFGGNIGLLFSSTVFVYVQENISWVLGYGVPTLIMTATFCIFMSRTTTYQHSVPRSRPFIKICRLVTTAFQKVRLSSASQKDCSAVLVTQDDRLEQPLLSKHLRFQDKAKIVGDEESATNRRVGLFSDAEIKEVKLVLGLIPIWVTTLMSGVIYNQSRSSFIKQGKAMNRKIGSNFEVPSAALQTALSLSIALFLPFYDRVFVPLTRKITGNDRGITMLQRISFGLVFSTFSMIVAALVEMKRLKLINELRLENVREDITAMSISWLLPQYILLGLAHVFARIGMEEFFYEQMPVSLKSFGIAMYLGIVGVGELLGAALVAIVDNFSSRYVNRSWFDDNMNKAHFDYFYLLLAALNSIVFYLFVVTASGFK